MFNKLRENKMNTMMHRFTYFSEHAIKRINERTRLTNNNIADIIDLGLAVDVGTERIFNRKHWLIYSVIDEGFFVAIQDSYTGLVVTVLPVEYHENLAWKIDECSLTEAKSNIEVNDIPSLLQEFTKQLNYEPSKNIHVKVRYLDNNNTVKTKSLFKLPAAQFNYSSENILIDKRFNNNIRELSEFKGINPLSIFEVLLSYKKEKSPKIIAWQA